MRLVVGDVIDRHLELGATKALRVLDILWLGIQFEQIWLENFWNCIAHSGLQRGEFRGTVVR